MDETVYFCILLHLLKHLQHMTFVFNIIKLFISSLHLPSSTESRLGGPTSQDPTQAVVLRENIYNHRLEVRKIWGLWVGGGGGL